MQVFFDIQHKGELFLDDEGDKFASVDAACDYLVHTVCEFIQAGGEVDDIQDMVIDITDRGSVCLTVPISELLIQTSGCEAA